MKKIALSTLVICSALSTVAHAQTSVTVYGQIDEAIAVGVGSGKGTTTQLVNGGLRASRIGFMGSEDLGGGLRTIFLLESGFNANNGAQTQPGLIFGRKAYVGFSSSTYGTAIAGRMYTLSYSTVDFFDPQLGIGGGNDNMFTRGGTRWSNTLRYDSPTFGGFSGAGVAAAGTQSMALGAVLGVVGSLAGTFGGYQVRTRLVKTLKVPDVVIAVLEDAVAIGGGLFIVSRF